MHTYNIWTVGCQMNVSDSERLDSGLQYMGLRRVDDHDQADISILNTCVVRQSAEDTATGLLGSLKLSKSKSDSKMIIVMGCMVGTQIDNLSKRFPQVDLWAQPQQFDKIIEGIAIRFRLDPEGCLSNLIPMEPEVTTYVPVVHGCDKFCTFCIIPYRRGREESRPLSEVINEVKKLTERGVREVTLLGQNIDSYGHDLRPREDLADLLESVSEIEQLRRIRFLTSHPNDMSKRIIKAVANLPKVCESVNLPFQAGDDRILANMRRGYTRSQYLEKVSEVRENIPGVTLTTDLIIGFPGETDNEFGKSISLIEEVWFDKIHSAIYSERNGTYASRQIRDNVSRNTKKQRLHKVMEIQQRIQKSRNSDLVGQKFEVLIDGVTRGKLRGRTRGDKLVYITGGRPALGETVNVTITNSSPWSLEGDLRAAQFQKELVQRK